MADDLLKQIVEKLNDIGEQTKSTDQRLSSLEKQISNVEERLDRHDKKLDTIIEQVVKNSETLTEYAEQLVSLSKTQALLVAGQQKQDKILEALAMHSLEQETDIRDLKRIK